MSQFKHINRESSTVQSLMEIWNYLNLNPPYQREGNIWSLAQKRLFINSLINGFDVPKLYFRRVNETQDINGEQKYIRYEVVDGKQRMETIHDFLEGNFNLGRDIKLFGNEDIDLKGMEVSELKKRAPDVFFDLNTYEFDIVLLDGMSEEIVDEFFIRLNEGTSLNAQEKRNAITCAISKNVKEVADKNPFIQNKLRKKTRYKNVETVAKFFTIVEQQNRTERISDTKKSTLDRLYLRSKKHELSDTEVAETRSAVEQVLDSLTHVFSDQDPLLYSLGNITVFFYSAFIQQALWGKSDTLKLLKEFETNRRQKYKDTEPQNLQGEQAKEYLILDKYNQYVQSTNDGTAIRFRSQIINYWIQSQGDITEFIRLVSNDEDDNPEQLELE